MRVVTTKDKKMPKNKNGMQNFCFKIKKKYNITNFIL